MLKIVFAIIYVSLLQECVTVLQHEYVQHKPQDRGKDFVMDVDTNEESVFGDLGKAENSYGSAEQQQDEESSASAFGNTENEENRVASKDDVASKQMSNERRQTERIRNMTETSGKYHENVGSSQQSGYNSALKQQRKQQQQTTGNAVARTNADTVHKRFRQKSSKKYSGKPGLVIGGRRWRSKVPRPWYGPYRVRKPVFGYRKRALWCKLYKARLRYILMGYHKRHLGHFLPFGLHYPSLKKSKTKSTYTEEQNLNRNININNNVNNNDKTKERQDYQHSRDASSTSSRVAQPKHTFKTNMERDEYNDKAQSQDSELSDLENVNSKYGLNQNKNTVYSHHAGEEQSGYKDETEGEEYNEADESNGLYNKKPYYEEPYEIEGGDEEEKYT